MGKIRKMEDVHCPECGAFVDQIPVDDRTIVLECELCGVSFEYPMEDEENLEYGEYDDLDDSL